MIRLWAFRVFVARCLVVSLVLTLLIYVAPNSLLAAPVVQTYSPNEWVIILQKKGISLKNWGGMSDEALTFLKQKKPRNRQAWLRIIQSRYPNIATRQDGNVTMVYILPAGIAQKHIQAVTAYGKKTNDPFALFTAKKLRPIKKIMKLPEIKVLQSFANIEKERGIDYERFVNPPQHVTAYHFRVEYVAQYDAMLPIQEKSSSQQQGLEGFAYAGSVLSYIQANMDKSWLQYKAPDGSRYFKTKAFDAPLFVIQYQATGEATIAMRMTMPNGTPFRYVIRKKEQTFTSTTTLQSSSGLITLLDFATLRAQ